MGQRVCPQCGDGEHLIITSIDVEVKELINYVETDKRGEVTYDMDYDFYPEIQTTMASRLIFKCGYCEKIYAGDTIEQVANKEMVDAI